MIDSYQNLVFSICYKMTQNYFESEDLAQETFLAAYRNLDSFEQNYEKAWLCKIAMNKCKDYQKSAARRMVATPDEEFAEIKSPGESTEEQVLEREVKEQLKTACQGLRSPYREVALLYYYQEKEMAEIAQERGKSIKTIQTQIYRARAQLREQYGREWKA